MRKPWEKSFTMRRARLGIKKPDNRSRLEKPIERRRLNARHTPHVKELLREISALQKEDYRGLVFDVVLDLAKKGRPYEQLYSKLLLSALAYCDKSLDRFHDDMKWLGIVIMHRKGEDGRWMREAITEGNREKWRALGKKMRRTRHLDAADDDEHEEFWDEDDDDDEGGVLVDA